MLHLLQVVYSFLGISHIANGGDLFGAIFLIFLLIAAFFQLKSAKEQKLPVSTEETTAPEKQAEVEKAEVVVAEVKKGPTWQERLKKGLGQSRTEVWGKIGSIFGAGVVDEEMIESAEELLYGADLGPEMVEELIDYLTTELKGKDLSEGEFKDYLFEFLKKKIESIQEGADRSFYDHIKNNKSKEKPETKVIMVVGVNGAGKTTTIGKLATKLTQLGGNVVVGAGDTFRAAAVEQLEVWCNRAKAKIIKAKTGAGPSGVGHEALETALNSHADYCILDTAGRLHNNSDLMAELEKFKNVLKKLDQEAPHHILLVIDAITGQNAIRQALEFHKHLSLTGLVLTKCDGSSKAGSAVSIVDKLKVPINFIGVGEDVDDLNTFDVDEYLLALLDHKKVND
jgi:fused signal recognition particle receptor